MKRLDVMSKRLLGIVLLLLLVLIAAVHANAQSCVQPPSGLVSWWPGDGNTTDIAGANDGTLQGGATFATGFITSENGQAFSLDGLDDVVRVPDDLTLDNTGEISIAFWVSINQPLGQTGNPDTEHQYLVDKREGFGNARGYTFCFDCVASGEISFGFGDGLSGNHVTSSGLSITPDTFHFFVGTASRSNDFVRIYHNGVLIVNGSWGGLGTVTNNNPLFIGRPNGCCTSTLGVLNGIIDEVQLFDRPLTAGEIQAEFLAGSAGKCKKYVITAIRPRAGGDTGSVTATITGAGFGDGATVKLVRSGEPDIVGSPVTVGDGGTSIATPFDLTGKTRGAWDVVVTNLDGTSIVLAEGFTIEEGRAAQVWVDVVGLNLIRPNRPQRFHILYGNRGNINAVGVPVWIGGIPQDSTLQFEFQINPPPVDANPNKDCQG